jgi:hypothetical protein
MNSECGLTDYELRHQPAHLAQILDERLDDLLRHQASNGRNFWYEVKALTGNLSGYLADIELASRRLAALFDQKSSQDVDISMLMRQLQYALMQSSARAATAVLNVGLLAGLLNTGVWPTTVALDRCRQIVDAELRVKCLLEIGSRISQDHRKQDIVLEALDAAKSIDVPHVRDRCLLSLVQHLTGEVKIAVISDLLEAAKSSSDSGSSQEILVGLSTQLAEHPRLVQRAIEIIRGDRDVAGRIRSRTESYARFAAAHFGDKQGSEALAKNI